MEPSSSRPHNALLEDLRRHRGELRESMSALENALAAPPTADRERWAQRVHVALVEVSGDLRQHVEKTEGPDGLYGDLLGSSPRLAGPVAALTREHVQIRAEVEALMARVTAPDASEDPDEVRSLGTALLGSLVRHRQRGSDLVYEAYEFDIGGET